MKKEELVTSISILLNRPSREESDVDYFENKKHDDLVEDLRQYLNSNSDYIGAPKIEVLQGLNDHGVDLILTSHNNLKIGFQIKSHVDVKSPDFASNVKRQIAESAFHGIQKLYILICAPFSSGKENYKAKISHLLSELSSYKTNYHCTYSPLSCVGLFLDNKILDQVKFYSVKKQYTIEKVDKRKIIDEIAPEEFKTTFLHKLKEENSINFENVGRFIQFLEDQDFELNKEDLIKEIEAYCVNLKSIPLKSREFFISVLKFASSYGQLGNCINCIKSPYIDVQDTLELDHEEMLARIKNLERFNLLNYDEFDPWEDGQIVIGVIGSEIDDDFNLSFEIREFLQNDINKLKSFFIDLTFNELD